MAAVWLRFRADVRRHGWALIVLGVLLGVAGGVVMTAAAGARRTDSTLSRYSRVVKPADVLANPDQSIPAQPWAAVNRLPQVEAVGTDEGVAALPVDAHDHPDLTYFNSVIVVNADAGFGRTVERVPLIAGHYPDQSNPHEVLINEKLAHDRHLHVGSQLHIFVATMQDMAAPDPSKIVARTTFPVTVTGLTLSLDEASRAADDPRLQGSLMYTEAFGRQPLVQTYGGKAVRLRHGARDIPAFEAAVTQLLHQNVNFVETRLTFARANRAIRPYVFTLWAFALLSGLIGGVIVAQAMSREHRADAVDHDVLRSIGFSRRELAGLGALRGALIGVVAVVVAPAIAWLASAFMPIGPLRHVDPLQGRSIDTTVFLVGAAILFLLATGHGMAAHAYTPSRRRQRVHYEVPAAVPPPVATGIRLAFDRGRGAGALPLRSTLLGVTIAIAALVASSVYGSALAHFTSTPRLYGWVWDYQIEPQDQSSLTPTAQHLARIPEVSAFTTGEYAQLDFGRESVAAIAVTPKPGMATVDTIAGRAPAAPNEIALGGTTMRTLHTRVGGTVNVHVGNRVQPLRVVGQAVFARFAPYSGSEPTGLGIGAAVTTAALPKLTAGGQGSGTPYLLVKLRPGAHVTAAQLSDRLFGVQPANSLPQSMVLGAQRPNDVLSYQHLERMPFLLAALLVLLGAATTVHLLVTSVRRRRKDLGLLKAIGCTVRQIVTVVLTQASTLVLVTLLVAIPLGVIAGRTAWSLTAHWLGVAAPPVIPLGTVLVVILAAIIVGNLAAFWPGFKAGRVRAAVALRTE
jgi:ABC-type antimicrobial peptide transport system permease subunit